MELVKWLVLGAAAVLVLVVARFVFARTQINRNLERFVSVMLAVIAVAAVHNSTFFEKSLWKQIDEAATQAPGLSAVKELHPELYDSILVLGRGLKTEGRSEGEIAAEFRLLVAPTAASLVVAGSDSLILRLADVQIREFEALNAIDPSLCYRLLFCPDQHALILGQIPDSLIKEEHAAVDCAIRDAAVRPHDVSDVNQMPPEIDSISAELAEIYGDRFSLFGRTDLTYATEMATVSQINIDLWRRVRALPPDRASATFRWMMAPRQTPQ